MSRLFLPDRSDKKAALKGPHAGRLAAERLRATEGMELEPADFVRMMSVVWEKILSENPGRKTEFSSRVFGVLLRESDDSHRNLR